MLEHRPEEGGKERSRKGVRGTGQFDGYIVFSLILLILCSYCVLPMPTGLGQEAGEEGAEVGYMHITADVNNNYATTNIYELVRNPSNDSATAMFTFEIPEKAFISNFSLCIDNETYYADIVSKEEGKQAFENATINGTDAGLVEDQGSNVFSYSISLSPGQEILVGLRYEQFLEKRLGGYEYVLPFSSGHLDHTIEALSIDITIRSDLHVNSLAVENYPDASVDWISSREVAVSYNATDTIPSADLLVAYELAAPPINGTIMNYNDGSSEYFFHIFSPQRSDLGGEAMPKDIIFVLDRSGSMSGEKIEQLKQAFAEIVDQLLPEDRFNIVLFDSAISQYSTELIGVSQENKSDAVDYINEIMAGGSTNINDAMLTALDMFETSETTVPIIVMLTDGLPTAGTTNTEAIRENVLDANTASVAIFSLGFGYNLDFDFLKAMSLENNGIALRIYEGQDASEQITDFYDTISTPLLKNLLFSYSESAYDVHPVEVGQLFEGAEVVVVGKYEGTEKMTSTVEALSWEGTKTFTETFTLEQDTNHTFIPRFWAYWKIQHLLDEIAVAENDTALVENVTALAIEYGFVTPYTSLLVETPEETSVGGEGEDDWNREYTNGTTGNGGGSYDSTTPVAMAPSESASDVDGFPKHLVDPSNQTPDDGASSEPPMAASTTGEGLGLASGLVPNMLLLLLMGVAAIVGYSKIERHRLLEHERREMIYNYIHEKPGEHFRGVEKALGLEVGVLTHHINKLEHEDYIRSRQDGMYRRFYPMDAKIDIRHVLSE
ncbi:MAG: VWA domain-containing protein, partial [Thermoplasmata archaeon]|nr:VWA domain-containing protein [Thermoplasmata archaeon]